MNMFTTGCLCPALSLWAPAPRERWHVAKSVPALNCHWRWHLTKSSFPPTHPVYPTGSSNEGSQNYSMEGKSFSRKKSNRNVQHGEEIGSKPPGFLRRGRKEVVNPLGLWPGHGGDTIKTILPFLKCQDSSVFPDGLCFMAEFSQWTLTNRTVGPCWGGWALPEGSSRDVCSRSDHWILESHQGCSTSPYDTGTKFICWNDVQVPDGLWKVPFPQVICLGVWCQSESRKLKNLGICFPCRLLYFIALSLQLSQGAAVSQEKPDTKSI